MTETIIDSLYFHLSQVITSAYLKVMMLGCLSFRRCLMSVSLMFRTFFTATSCPCNLPRKTAPWAPLPTHCRSDISSNGTSHSSEARKNKAHVEERNCFTNVY